MPPLTLGIVLAIAQAILWANTTIALRSLASRLDPFLVNSLRGAVGMLIIIPLVFITGGLGDYRLMSTTRVLHLAVSVALGGVIGDALYVSSLKTLGVTRAFPITNSYPVFTVLSSALLLGEQITWRMVVGMLLAMVGIYFVARPRGQVLTPNAPTLTSRQLIVGVLQGLGTAFLWGVNTVILAIGLRGINSIVANSIRVPVLIVLGLIFSAFRGTIGSVRRLDWPTVRLLIIAGILGWGIGGSLYVTAVQLAGPSRTAIIGTASPLFAVPLSMFFLHEKPTRSTLLGTVMTVVGIVLVV